MVHTRFRENKLLTKKHILLCDEQYESDEFKYITKHFCGKVIFDTNEFTKRKYSFTTILYLCGDISKLIDYISFTNIKTVYVIENLSSNFENFENYKLINSGQVPLNMFNVGIFFRRFFDPRKDYYESITNEHEFQSLKLGNKPGTAYRKGIYLTNVNKVEDGVKFNLLRCSTNLSGPTDNFRSTDSEIVDCVNSECKYFFKYEFEFNHVLAQTYHNSILIGKNNIKKERKAKIARHSDKTKDMPKTGLIAFTTFYKDFYNDSFNSEDLKHTKRLNCNPYNHCYKNISVLTKLRFILKDEVKDESLKKRFDVTLYPNSVFVIPLSTNRLYTHEIVPSMLPINKIPTRMGYVIRCSNTEAIFKDNITHIVKHGKHFKLEDPTKEGIDELKKLYLIENKHIDIVDYEDKFFFSLNKGDYTMPLV